MKIKLRRPSPAMAVALLALFLAVGGNVVAYGLGRNSVHSRDIAPGAVRASDLGKLRLRTSGLEARERLELTQEQVAERSGVYPGEISRIESGKRDPQVSTLERLAKAVEVTPGQLLDGLPPA